MYDEEDGLDLSGPDDGNEDLYREFWDWVTSRACAHEHMEQASVHVANWSGYRLFQQALGAAGWQRFPTLREYLPQANGGLLPAAAAPAALAELAVFEGESNLGEEIYLTDEETGERLAVGVPSYHGVFIWDGRTHRRVGVDAAGLFVHDVSAAPTREEFRSLRCTQEVIGHRPGGEGQLVRLTDAVTSVQVTVPLTGPVGVVSPDQADGVYPRRLRVQSAPVSGADFHHIVEALTVVVTAARSTGNPVVWC